MGSRTEVSIDAGEEAQTPLRNPEALEAMIKLTLEQRVMVQNGLISLGYDIDIVDGAFGFHTRKGIAGYQQRKGFLSTGFLTSEQSDSLVALGKARDGFGVSRPSVSELGASLDLIRQELSDIRADLERLRQRVTRTQVEPTVAQGEFGQSKGELRAGSSMDSVLDALTSGHGIMHWVTIPEGFTVAQVIARLMETDQLEGEVAEIPREGSLAPETYAVSRGESRQSVIDRMKEAQDAILEEAWSNKRPDLPLESPSDVLILASIVEKETGVGSERAEVAAVFANRLRERWPLQSDPTVVYGLTLGQESLGRGLRQSELKKETPYNTYLIRGLPPTPIANPGRAAIEATVQPNDSRNMYFVADGSGGHVFAETLDQHNRNVAKWRRVDLVEQARQKLEPGSPVSEAPDFSQSDPLDPREPPPVVLSRSMSELEQVRDSGKEETVVAAFLEELERDQVQTPQVVPDTAAQPFATAPQRLTREESEGLKFAISECWSVPIGIRYDSEFKVTLGVELDRDGHVEGTPRLIEPGSIETSEMKQAFNAARRAVLRCQPYDLPVDQYEHWRSMEVEFNPSNLRLSFDPGNTGTGR